MKGFCLHAALFFLILSIIVAGLARSGASDNAIIFGVIGLGIVLGAVTFFWTTRPRRRPLNPPPGMGA